MKTAKTPTRTSKLNKTGMTDAAKAEWRAAKSAQLDGRVTALKKLNEKPAAAKPAPERAHTAPATVPAEPTPEPFATPAPVAERPTIPAVGDAKPARERKPREGKMGCLNAAAQVLAASATPMTAKGMIDAMAAQSLWTSPGGKTPAATLYAAISREIKDKGDQARFKKMERGLFAAR